MWMSQFLYNGFHFNLNDSYVYFLAMEKNFSRYILQKNFLQADMENKFCIDDSCTCTRIIINWRKKVTVRETLLFTNWGISIATETSFKIKMNNMYTRHRTYLCRKKQNKIL